MRVSNPTLTNYVKQEIIDTSKLPNGRYDYDEKSVYSFMNKDIPRKNMIYARVSTKKQKKDLLNQIQSLKSYCFQNGMVIDGIYEDIASRMKLDLKNLLLLISGLQGKARPNKILAMKNRKSILFVCTYLMSSSSSTHQRLNNPQQYIYPRHRLHVESVLIT